MPPHSFQGSRKGYCLSPKAFVQAGAGLGLMVGGEPRQRVKHLLYAAYIVFEEDVYMQLYSIFSWFLPFVDKGICLKIRVTYCGK